MIVLSLPDRAEAAFETLIIREEWVRANQPDWIGVTDSDVLNAIDAWTLGTCADACTSSDCCDYQRLSELVWILVERAVQTPDNRV